MRFWLYLAPIVLLPVGMIVAACWIVPSRWLQLHARNAYLANIGYGAKLRNTNCEIVIYGDSSAMVGIDPAALTRRTGMSACNLAELEGMTILNGTMPLDDYLAHNARPRFLLFVYTPEDFDPAARRSEVATFEAITWRMEQPGKPADFAAVMRHPEEFFSWAEQGLRLAVERARTPAASVAVQRLRADHGGQLPIEAPAMTSCGGHVTSARNKPDRAWVAALRAKYASGGTVVLIDPTPAPPCDPELEPFQHQLAGLTDEPIRTLPLGDFTTDGRLHMNAAGAQQFSAMIAEQIMQRGHPAPATSQGGR